MKKRFRDLAGADYGQPAVAMGQTGKGYVTLHVNENQLPEIKGWKAGTEYEVEVKVVMTKKSHQVSEGSKSPIWTAHLEVRSIRADDEKVVSGYGGM